MTELKDVFKQAAEIAQSVPENMQQIAFTRALDFLTGKGAAGSTNQGRKIQRRSAARHANKPDSDVKSKAQRKPASALGPKSAVNSLNDTGYFDTGKTRAEVQEHLRTTRGYNISTDQLGMAMLRLVREEVLERTKNEDGQYEFRKRTK